MEGRLDDVVTHLQRYIGASQEELDQCGSALDDACSEWEGDDINLTGDPVVSIGEDSVWVLAWVRVDKS